MSMEDFRAKFGDLADKFSTEISASNRAEPIIWHYLPELPDDETTCLIAHVSDETDQPTVGYHSGGEWWWENPAGRDVPAFFGAYAWAYLPANPPKKGAAS